MLKSYVVSGCKPDTNHVIAAVGSSRDAGNWWWFALSFIFFVIAVGLVYSKRNYGVAWSLGPWLLPVFVQKVGPEVTRRLQARVVAELKTTFASHYTKEISLAGALHADEIAVYARRVTGEKYLVNPQKT